MPSFLDPQYNTYMELFRYYNYGSIVHSRMILRHSNDVMFISNNKEMMTLYLQSLRLYGLLETLNNLIADNPLFNCEVTQLDFDENNLSILEGVSEDVRQKYQEYFSVIFSCLKTLLSKIDNQYKRNLNVNDLHCGDTTEFETSSGGSGLYPGDYGNDYNTDFLN